METRAHKTRCEVREGPTGSMIVGYAAVFNRDSENLGGFIEQVDPGAFDKTLAEADVRALLNHDSNWMLGRSKSGSLRLATDNIGLRYEIDIDPSDVMAASTLSKVRRGDLDGSSFSFRTIADAWDWSTQPAQRRLLEVALIDVGPVCFPAYADSTASARALDKVARKVGHPVEELVMALQSGDPAEIRSLVEPPEPTDPDGETADPAEALPPAGEVTPNEAREAEGLPAIEPEFSLPATARRAMRSLAAALVKREEREMPDGPGDPENMAAMVGAVMVAYNAKLAELGMEPDDDGFYLSPMADQDGDADGDGPTLFMVSDSTACWYILADGSSASVVAFDAYDMEDGWGYYRRRETISETRSWATIEAELRMRERAVAEIVSR